MNLSINNNNFLCRVVSSPEKIRSGMMFKTFDGFDGMLFIMPEDTIQTFWMKNCVVPLDIIFISDGIIQDISPKCPPCVEDDCPQYMGKGGMVLEVLSGTCRKKSIKIGDKIDFQF